MIKRDSAPPPAPRSIRRYTNLTLSTGTYMSDHRMRSARQRRVRQCAVSNIVSGTSVFVAALLIIVPPIAAQSRPAVVTDNDNTVSQSQAGGSLALEHATIVDVQSGRLLADQTVVIIGNRINAIGAAGNVRLPTGTRVIDARGRYLIPGLWDMHVHLWGYSRIMYPLFVAYGVTGIRGMSEVFPLDSLLQWRRETAAGTRVGPPRQIVTGGFLQTEDDPGERALWGDDGMIITTTPDIARRAVDSLKTAGVDFIKVHSISRPDVFFAIMDEARRLKIPVAGHLPGGVTPGEASDSGLRSIEHGADLRAFTCAGRDGAAPPVDAARDLAERFARNGTWLVPTVVTYHYMTHRAPDHLRYWPAALHDQQLFWGEVSDAQANATPLECRARGIAARLHQAGVRLLTGTDTSPWSGAILPGLSVHEEMDFLVQGGVSPLDALRAATLHPAQYLEATDSLGTVATGKLADLVLLDADPLTDIRNTTKINAVIANGRYFDQAALDALMVEAEQTAADEGRQP